MPRHIAKTDEPLIIGLYKMSLTLMLPARVLYKYYFTRTYSLIYAHVAGKN